MLHQGLAAAPSTEALGFCSTQRYSKSMTGTVSHSFHEETLESKARWFQSLPISERIELLCSFTDLMLENNPSIVEYKDDQPARGRVRVLSKT